MKLNFKKQFMKNMEHVWVSILFPTEKDLQNSSLAHYLGLAVKVLDTEESHYPVNGQGIDTNRLLTELHYAEETGNHRQAIVLFIQSRHLDIWENIFPAKRNQNSQYWRL